MQNLYAHQSQNVTKTWLLMSGFFVILAIVGYALSSYYGDIRFFAWFIGISILMNVVSYWYSDKLVLRLSRARTAGRDEFPDFWNSVERLSAKAGLPMPKLYIIEDPAPNAFATGRNKEHAAVAATTGLLAVLEREELDGVIAHELAHVGNRDILLSTVVAILVGSIAIAADVAIRGTLFRDRESDRGGVLAIISLVFLILAPIAATLIQLAISRKREFLADTTAGILTGHPQGLASALQKIAEHHRPLRNAHTATAHLFISNPLSGSASSFAKLFMTHPPMEERIRALLGHR